MAEILKRAQEIIEKHNLKVYLDELMNYWEQEVPLPGHTFSHVLEVAVNAYETAILNDYEKPEELFVAGLYHDVYRPVNLDSADADQSKGAEVVKQIFTKSSFDTTLMTKIVDTIIKHDEFTDENPANNFDLILSIADKQSYDIDRADALIREVRSCFKKDQISN